MALKEIRIAGRYPGRVQHNQIQRGCVGRAVVGCVRDCLEVRELAQSQLVHDLPGLGIAVIIPLLRLVAAENLQCGGRELRINQRAL